MFARESVLAGGAKGEREGGEARRGGKEKERTADETRGKMKGRR